MKFKLNNDSNLNFTDISGEESRNYRFPNGSRLTISNPQVLNVSDSGGHRIVDAENVCWYINPSEGWWINWTPKEGKPHFVK